MIDEIKLKSFFTKYLDPDRQSLITMSAEERLEYCADFKTALIDLFSN